MNQAMYTAYSPESPKPVVRGGTSTARDRWARASDAIAARSVVPSLKVELRRFYKVPGRAARCRPGTRRVQGGYKVQRKPLVGYLAPEHDRVPGKHVILRPAAVSKDATPL